MIDWQGDLMNLCEYMCPGCYPRSPGGEPTTVKDDQHRIREDNTETCDAEETTAKNQPSKQPQPTTEELDAQVWPVHSGESIRQVCWIFSPFAVTLTENKQSFD